MKKFIWFFVLAALVFASAAYAADDVYVIDQEMRWTDVSKYYAEYAWKVKVHNTTGYDKAVTVKFRLLDKNDFVLDENIEYKTIGAWEQRWISDTGMVKRHIADQAESSSVLIRY